MTNTRPRFQRYFSPASLTAPLVAGCSSHSTALGHLAPGDDGGQAIADGFLANVDAPTGNGGGAGESSPDGGAGGEAGANSSGEAGANSSGGAGANDAGGSGGSTIGKSAGGTDSGAGGLGVGGNSGGVGGNSGGVGGNSGGVGEKGTGPVADAGMPDAFSAATAESFCLGYYTYAYQFLWTCVGGRGTYPGQSAPAFHRERVLKSIAAGRIQYDRAHGAACLAELAAGPLTVADCQSNLFPASASDCQLALVAQVPPGGACTVVDPDVPSDECVGGGYCDDGGDLYACTGICRSYLDVGASCTQNGQQCKEGTTCNAAPSGSTPGNCVANGGAGQSCEGPSGAGCLTPNWCMGGSATAAGVCQPLPTSGPCTSKLACAWGNACAGPSGNRTCTPPKQSGDAYIPGNQECIVDSYCTAAGMCSDHLGVEGDPCGTILGEFALCDFGFYCDAPSAGSGTCHAQKTPGTSCSSGDECSGPGDYGHCDSVTSTCVSCNG